jgi:hypothetical protein
MPVPRGRLTGLTNRTQSAILDAYQYEYDTATMISAITRNQQKMSFAYDKTYQLTSEIGCYASNCVPFVSFVVSNQFCYMPPATALPVRARLPRRVSGSTPPTINSPPFAGTPPVSRCAAGSTMPGPPTG